MCANYDFNPTQARSWNASSTIHAVEFLKAMKSLLAKILAVFALSACIYLAISFSRHVIWLLTFCVNRTMRGCCCLANAKVPVLTIHLRIVSYFWLIGPFVDWRCLVGRLTTVFHSTSFVRGTVVCNFAVVAFARSRARLSISSLNFPFATDACTLARDYQQ